MTRRLNPWLGVLLFLGFAQPSQSLETAREILVEVSRPVTLQTTQQGVRSGLPDLDAILNQSPESLVRYALKIPTNRHSEMKKYLLIRVQDDHPDAVRHWIAKLERLESVHWARSNRLFAVNFTPDDPLFPQQWGLEKINASSAWDLTRGSVAVPIAIIDTGCQMDHPDLVSTFWTNAEEIPDNGIDDDGNGFVDDIHGWDFVDAPTFPSGGDYLIPDNDPSDEMGHGTAIAGICGGAIHNGIGIAGLAPECPLMIIRAGNMNGFLQEDDVASAILYALDNGARIANMSFGDTQASPMLEDVINYASQSGMLMVASSGNFGSSELTFPGAFGPTLCVGASNENNGRAVFSSYGSALDIIAPGTNIISTLMDSQYGAFQGGNGTSFSTAFVSAAAGLVLSLHPEWNAAMVSSVLKETALDVPPVGWDQQHGQGILRVDLALEIEEALTVEILSPIMSQGFSATDTIQIMGTAAGVYLQEYSIYTGLGNNPLAWNLIKTDRENQVVNGHLGIWRNTEPLDTAYTIRVEAMDRFGNTVDDRVVIYYDPSPPQITDISLVSILDGDRPSYLLSFHTDDLTIAKVWLKGLGVSFNRWISQSLNYRTTDHIILLGGDLIPDQYQYYIWAQNSTGLVDSTEVLGVFDLRQPSIATNNFVELPPCGVPPGYLLEDVTDLDGDGFMEIWQDSLAANGSKADLRVWEATSSWSFTDLHLNFGKQIPKSIGDSDADGLPELLTLYAGSSKIFEATAPGGLPQPDHISWSDSGDVWGAKLMDLTPGDGHGEVLLVSGGTYQLYANSGTGALTFLQALPNPFLSSPTILPPYCRINDYDGDNKKDLLFGDYDGNLFIYERQEDNSFQLSWSQSLPLLDTGEFLTDGDYDGDGAIEFAALAHTQTILAGEHLADTRYWALYIFKTTGDNAYSCTDTMYFFGAENPADFASGINSGDVYGTSSPEILVCVYPDFYVLQWNPAANDYEVIWYYPECRSNKAVVGDFNRNGHNDLLFNSGSVTRIFEAVGSWSYWPPPPLNFTATPKPDRVTISWSPVEGALSYNLYRYRNSSTAPLDTLIIVNEPNVSYTDFFVELDSTYYYAVSTMKLGQPEGPTTVPIKAIPNNPPYVLGDTAHFVYPNFVTIEFNEPMSNSILDPNNYWIAASLQQPNSIVADQGGKKAVLTFDPVFIDSTYRLIIFQLYDLQGSILSTLNDTLYFTVSPTAQSPPYLVTAAGDVAGNRITLLFSQAMNTTELAFKGNYTVTADPITGLSGPASIVIANVELDTSLTNRCTLKIDPKTPIGAMGKVYRITARNLHSQTGILLDPAYDTVTLTFGQEDLRSVYVYPNPYTGGTLVDGEACVVFANLTNDVEIRILTLEGIVIKTLKSSGDIYGGMRWYLDNEYGEQVGSGVYLYQVQNDEMKIWGKLAVVR